MNKALLFQLEKKEIQDTYGEFVIEPLEQGYGHTLGTSLRRVLLTGLPGAAITQVKIAGMKHQFGPLKGVKEDGIDLLLNLKKIRISYEGDKPLRLTLAAKGKGPVVAGDIKTPSGVQIANPDLVIATLADSKSKLELELQLESGVGYSPSEDRKTNIVGQIPLDADFSPVQRVNYNVEETRVGRLTNYDKLTLQIWTDGSVKPDDAVKKASEILLSYFSHLVSPVVKNESNIKTIEKEVSLASKLSVEELSLPTRIANALLGAGYETVEDITRSTKTELAKIRNLGEKSVKIIETALGEKGVSWTGE